MRRLPVILLLAAGPVAAGEATSQQVSYYQAMGLARAGQPAQAQARLDALAEEYPEDRFADDALFKSAELCERQLLDLPGALTRYRRLIEQYPRSRLFRRARKRLDYLSANRGSGDRVLLEFEKILRETPLSDIERTRSGIERLTALLGQHPDFSQAPRVRYWIAEARFKLGQQDQAFADLRELARQYPDTDWALRARYRQGDALMSRREFSRAQEVYRSAGAKARGAAELARTWLWRQRTALAGIVLYLIFLLALVGRTRPWRIRAAELWPPPGEGVFLAPLVLLLIGLGYARSSIFWIPIAWLCLSGLLALTLGGLSFRVRPPGRAAAAFWAVSGMLAGAGLAYAVLYQYELLESVVHTWRFGTEG